jgi:hypothetical protein
MLKKVGMAMLLVGVLAGAASAGYKNNTQVYVDPVGRVAYGTVGGARNSSDSNQRLGCAIWGSTSTELEAYCYATDQNGVSFSCYGINANVIAAAQHATGDSWISIYGDASGFCTEIDVYNGSQYQPKQP